MKKTILLVDDEKSQREALNGFLKKQGFEMIMAEGYGTAVELLKDNPVDLVLSDYQMPDKTGDEVLRAALEINPEIPVVIMTAFGTVDTAVSLLKEGAFDYIQKPLELDELLMIIDRALERSMLISENTLLRKKLKESASFDSIISASSEMENVLNLAARVAPSRASVMVRGESGTGKELIAKAIHNSSDRADAPFVVVNCAALPETLFESELFGHEKGAYTGANRERIGKFEEADGGTLFIDEVGDIPMQVQVKLLRAVQFGIIERLGSNSEIELDVRIVTATNRDLEKMIEQGEFREDLYYRFNVVTINIPPLRKRRADIPLLVEHFVQRYSKINGKPVKGISKEAMHALAQFDFPGNIRQLENIIQRAVVLTRDEVITVKDLPAEISAIAGTDGSSFDNIGIGDLNRMVEELEKTMIIKALDMSRGNQVKAADMLNISERTIRYKISKYGIK